MGLKKHLRRITKALTCSRSIKLSLNIIYDVSRGALIFQTAFMRMYACAFCIGSKSVAIFKLMLRHISNRFHDFNFKDLYIKLSLEPIQ